VTSLIAKYTARNFKVIATKGNVPRKATVKITTTTGVGNDTSSDKFKLFPNTFNYETTILFNVKTNCHHVTIKVYD
jgi:hypothetical protein